MSSLKNIRAALHGEHVPPDEFSVSLQTLRVDFEDSSRTILLKQALRESVNSVEKAKKGMPPSTARKALAKITVNKKLERMLGTARDNAGQKVLHPVHQSSEGLEKLRSSEQDDEEAIELADCWEFSDHLSDCAGRIDRLCDSLVSIRPPTPADGEVAAADGSRGEELAPAPKQAVDLVNSRRDKCTLDYISKNVKCKQLDDLMASMNQANDFTGLRKCFPEKYKHHANLGSLTDFQDDAAFKQCVWKEAPRWHGGWGLSENMRRRSDQSTRRISVGSSRTSPSKHSPTFSAADTMLPRVRSVQTLR